MGKPNWNKDRIANNLLRSGRRWNSSLGQSVTVTYSFPTSKISGYWGEGNGFSTFTAAQKTAARNMMAKWSEVSGLNLTESTTNSGKDGKVRLANTTTGPQVAWAYYPSSGIGGDVWINPNYGHNKSLGAGSYGLLTMVHEIGHAIGLSHPGNYNGTASSSQRRYRQDSRQHTVMSYFGHPNDTWAYAGGPLRDDIYAIQKAYGVNWDTRSGDTTYSWGDNPYFVSSIWDGGGIDTIDASNQTSRVLIRLKEGEYSSIGKKHYYSSRAVNNLSIAYGAIIENAKGGSGNDVLYGNAWNNVIEGNAGSDVLNGYGGTDTLKGGAGDDSYVLNSRWGMDTVIDAEGANTVVFASNQKHSLDFAKSGNDLIISNGVNGDQAKVTDYYLRPSDWTFKARAKVRKRVRRRGRWVWKYVWVNQAFTVPQTDSIVNATNTDSTLNVGGSVNGAVDYAYDKDMYKVTLQAGKTYRFDLLGTGGGGGTLANSHLRLYDAVGNTLKSDADSGASRDARLTYTATASGTYFISAYGTGAGTGSYQLAAQEVASPASPASVDLAVGSYIKSSIGSTSDTDLYKVSLVAGKVYRFDMKGRSSRKGSLYDPRLYFYDSDMRRISYNNNSGSGRDARLTFRASETGDFYVKADGVGSHRGSYHVYATELGETTTLNVGGSASGSISRRYESDWFKIDLVAGQKYQFDMKGRSSGSGSLRDPQLYLKFNNKTVAMNNNGGSGYDAKMTFEARDSGTYFILADAVGKYTGTYALSAVTLNTADDYAGDSGTAGALAAGEFATGGIDHVNDRDWFKVNLTAGETYQFDMSGNSSAIFKTTLVDPRMSLYGTDGTTLIGSNNDHGSFKSSRMTFTATTTGAHYISAESNTYSGGQYKLSMNKTFV